MNTHLKQLIEIANIDKESDAYEPIILEAKKSLDDLLNKRRTLESNFKTIEEDNQELNLQIARYETSITETNAALNEIQKKLSEAKSDRESKALIADEDTKKEQITHFNNEINRINKEIENRKLQEKELKEKQKELDSSIKETEISVQKQIDEIKAKQHEISLKKDKYTKTIDNKVIIFYNKIRKWAKNTSVVPVKRQACGGCFIRINDRMYADLLEAVNLITCPHCGRIIYVDKAQIAAEAEEKAKVEAQKAEAKKTSRTKKTAEKKEAKKIEEKEDKKEAKEKKSKKGDKSSDE